MIELERKTWRELKKLNPELVAFRAKVTYISEGQQYKLVSLGNTFIISLSGEEIRALDSFGKLLFKRLSYLISPIFLWYLIRADGREPSGNFLSYQSLRGGETFFRGSHQLPLQSLVEKFENASESLERAALKLDGQRFSPGDLGYIFFPLPKVPVAITFWRGDENLPASANLLFDSQAQEFLPLDILWAIGMYVCQAMTIASAELFSNLGFSGGKNLFD